MVCIYCHEKLGVINSRFQKKQNNVWRRRRCPNCGALFTTSESIDLSKVLMIKRPNSQLEPFSREKLFSSIYESCKHRKAPEKDAESLTTTIVTKVFVTNSNAVVELNSIKQLATEVLSNFDKASASHYQAYYC